MFIAERFRRLAEEYGSLASLSDKALQITKFRKLQSSNTASAENEERLHGIYERTLGASASNELTSADFGKEEEHVLRCLGAALLMRWSSLPTDVQRELFDAAGTMAELRDTADLRGQIARFLHRHKAVSAHALKQNDVQPTAGQNADGGLRDLRLSEGNTKDE